MLASILHESKIDPFDSQEAKPYKQDPEIVAMTNLVAAFRNKKIKVTQQRDNEYSHVVTGSFFYQREGDCRGARGHKATCAEPTQTGCCTLERYTRTRGYAISARLCFCSHLGFGGSTFNLCVTIQGMLVVSLHVFILSVQSASLTHREKACGCTGGGQTGGRPEKDTSKLVETVSVSNIMGTAYEPL